MAGGLGETNPPYRGWNWTSALESGMRLVQFTWIDALLTICSSRPQEARSSEIRNPESGIRRGESLLTSTATLASRMEALRQAILRRMSGSRGGTSRSVRRE